MGSAVVLEGEPSPRARALIPEGAEASRRLQAEESARAIDWRC